MLKNYRLHSAKFPLSFQLFTLLPQYFMHIFKLVTMVATIASLLACSPTQQKKSQQTQNKPLVGYLKADIRQAELNNPQNYKKYYYVCKNFITGGASYLTTYFPLSRESRQKENFGIYFQLDGGKVHPFDHLENIALNARGSKFEVRYRSYFPIDGSYVELKARQLSSIYYKHNRAWLECREN